MNIYEYKQFCYWKLCLSVVFVQNLVIINSIDMSKLSLWKTSLWVHVLN